MVMPSIPMDFSASLTSSSLCGWMMASIFFMAGSIFCGLRFEIITFFAVHADVQAFQLILGRYPDPQKNVADLQDDQSAHDRHAPGDQNADGLIQNLAAVAIHHS